MAFFLVTEKKKRGLQVACSQHAGRRMELDKLDLPPSMSETDHDRRRWGMGRHPKREIQSRAPGQLFKPNAGA